MAAIGSYVVVCGLAAVACTAGCVDPCQGPGSAIDSDLIAASIDHFVTPDSSAIVVYDYFAGPEMERVLASNPELLDVRPATIASLMNRGRDPAEVDPFAVQGKAGVEHYFVDVDELRTAFDPDPQWDAFLERHPGAGAAFRFSRAGVDCDQAIIYVEETTGPGGFSGYFGVFTMDEESWTGVFTQMWLT